MTVLELQNANIFQQNHLILKDVNLTIKKGEFAYLIGRTGTGKSSLLKTIYGEVPLTDGKGSVLDTDLRQLQWKTIPFLRRKLGMIFQDFKLLNDRSVEGNLMFVLKATGWKKADQIKIRINDVLDRVGLKDKAQKMPYELSGGEQQRVVIARAMLNRPEFILADEPTGNLDPETSDEIMDLFHRIAKTNNTAVLMATHNYSFLNKYPGKVIKCIEGRIVVEQDKVI